MSGTSKLTAAEMRQIEPYLVSLIQRVVPNSRLTRPTGSVGTGNVAQHDLGDTTVHTGQITQGQASWAYTKAEALMHVGNADAHHPRKHAVNSANDHSITAGIYSVVGATANNVLGVLATSSNGEAGNVLLRSSGSGGIQLHSWTASNNQTLNPVGNTILSPGGKYVEPGSGYAINLGRINKKYLTLHAAELWVETLVAQNTIATIGGRIMVGPTTTLIADLAPGATTVDVKHNQMVSGDIVHMEADGKLEFMAVTSGPTTITDGYRYSLTRNLDGSGANQWYAGDAMFNTGVTGNGFIDLYSLYGLRSATNISGGSLRAGPTIVGNVRLSSTYNDFRERWAIGNLNGLYTYSSDVYGSAFGDPTASWIAMDATNGIRIMRNTAKRFDITPAGVMSFYKSGGDAVIRMDASNGAYFASRILIDTAGEIVVADASSGDAVNIKQATGITLRSDTTSTYSSFDDRRALTYRTAGGVLVGQMAAYDASSVHGLQLYTYSTVSGSARMSMQAIQQDKVYGPTAPGAPQFVVLATTGSDLAAVFGEQFSIYTSTNTTPSWIFKSGYATIYNAAVLPGTVAGAGSLYVNGGALYYRGSSGTVTQIAPP